MQPGFVEVLNGVKKLLFEVFLPELQTPQARGQAMYAGLLLDHLAARWGIEVPLLAEEYRELVALLEAADRLLPASAADLKRRCETVRRVAGLQEAPQGPRELVAANEAMRPLIAEIAAAGDAPVEVASCVRSYLRRQHDRDKLLVATGGLTW